MTKEEAKKILQRMSNDGFYGSHVNEALKLGIEALKKQLCQETTECSDDEKIIKTLIEHFEWYSRRLVFKPFNYTVEHILDWLKKEREQNHAEWNEDDENRFRNLIYVVERSNEGKGTKEGFVKFINRLKSLRPQPKIEWGKEDEDYLKDVKCAVHAYFEEGYAEELCDWLHPHWKPSEEQVKAIDLAIRFVTDDFDEHPTLSETLRGLYNDLKKKL